MRSMAVNATAGAETTFSLVSGSAMALDLLIYVPRAAFPVGGTQIFLQTLPEAVQPAIFNAVRSR